MRCSKAAKDVALFVAIIDTAKHAQQKRGQTLQVVGTDFPQRACDPKAPVDYDW